MLKIKYNIVLEIEKLSMIFGNNSFALDIASFCYNYLGLTKEVNIDTVEGLDADGYCCEDGTIEINHALPKETFILTVCHEMIHCMQYERNRNACEEEAYTREVELFNKYKEYTNAKTN